MKIQDVEKYFQQLKDNTNDIDYKVTYWFKIKSEKDRMILFLNEEIPFDTFRLHTNLQVRRALFKILNIPFLKYHIPCLNSTHNKSCPICEKDPTPNDIWEIYYIKTVFYPKNISNLKKFTKGVTVFRNYDEVLNFLKILRQVSESFGYTLFEVESQGFSIEPNFVLPFNISFSQKEIVRALTLGKELKEIVTDEAKYTDLLQQTVNYLNNNITGRDSKELLLGNSN